MSLADKLRDAKQQRDGGPAPAATPTRSAPAPASGPTEAVEPQLDLRDDEPVVDLTNPNNVLNWHWEPADGGAGDPPSQEAAWSAYHDRARRSAESELDVDLPDNSTWSQRYRDQRGL